MICRDPDFVPSDRTDGFHHGQIHAVFFEDPAVTLQDDPDDDIDAPMLPPVESGINIVRVQGCCTTVAMLNMHCSWSHIYRRTMPMSAWTRRIISIT